MKHRNLLGIGTEAEYLKAADTFLGGKLPADVMECTRRRDGDRLRFRESTQEYGVLKSDGTIRIYYVCNGGRPRRTAGWFQGKCAEQ